MAVRHQYDIDRRQICEGDAWIVDPFRPDEAKRRRALRPHRVKQHIETRSLNQQAGMADIGDAPGRAFDACWRTVNKRRWRPGRPLRLGGAPVTIDEPAQQVTSASRRHTVRVEKPCAVKVIGDWAIVIPQHSGRILMR